MQQLLFLSIKFDQRLISARKMIKISICFIVNEVRQAGTRSHSAKQGRERGKEREPKERETRGKGNKEGKEREREEEECIKNTKRQQ